MKVRRKIIIRRTERECIDVPVIPTELVEKGLQMVDSAHGYVAYTERHGKHFTVKLAEDVSKRMVNANGTEHTWTAEHVKAAVGEYITGKVTLGDMVYLVNMAYADFFPKVLGTTEGCINYAKAVASDPDGYEGMTFMRWLADSVAKGEKINWDEYIGHGE